MANSSDLSTGKSVLVLAVVIGCFGVLWPKIFYPMMQAAFSITAPNYDRDEESFGENRHTNIDPELLPPQVRAAMEEGRPGTRPQIRDGRPLMHPAASQGPKVQPKSGGAMGVIMPIYTLFIVVFFMYSIFKFVFKKPSEDEASRQPMVKDFHMDPEHHKYVLSEEYKEERKNGTRLKNRENKTKKTLQKYGKVKEDELAEKDYEISQLRKRLEETEAAMERIMKHMGVVTEHLAVGMTCLPNSPVSTSTQDSENKDILLDGTEKKKKVTLTESDKEEENQPSSPDVDNYELVSEIGSIPTTPTNVSVSAEKESCETTSFEVIGQIIENNDTRIDSEDSISKELDTEQVDQPKDDYTDHLLLKNGSFEDLAITSSDHLFPENLSSSIESKGFSGTSSMSTLPEITRENVNGEDIEEDKSKHVLSFSKSTETDSDQQMKVKNRACSLRSGKPKTFLEQHADDKNMSEEVSLPRSTLSRCVAIDKSSEYCGLEEDTAPMIKHTEPKETFQSNADKRSKE
ncbi:resistance to inhibitors of cholinesterase protein 3-like isoform X2 [Limulus polyphemus]|uniref:Resistance to inhibitors of cholinesterase protein 3-like isoform X2 n=1 Tax=Limulus polyphemus TaxID=6850 RepID=A0ABM1S7L2_LIMPO|nr:resistance to inhibitors of cholinesterase protein 3-like isoform X2 [Limulus polyphemus]